MKRTEACFAKFIAALRIHRCFYSLTSKNIVEGRLKHFQINADMRLTQLEPKKRPISPNCIIHMYMKNDSVCDSTMHYHRGHFIQEKFQLMHPNSSPHGNYIQIQSDSHESTDHSLKLCAVPSDSEPGFKDSLHQ